MLLFTHAGTVVAAAASSNARSANGVYDVPGVDEAHPSAAGATQCIAVGIQLAMPQHCAGQWTSCVLGGAHQGEGGRRREQTRRPATARATQCARYASQLTAGER
eukprot:1534449-Alexandrium_andersonii.AAC.1